MTESMTDDVAAAPVRSAVWRWRWWWAGSLLVLVLLPAALGIGFWLGSSGNADVVEQNQRLQAQLTNTLGELETARQRLVVSQAESQVGRQSRDQLREQIRALRDQIAELREAVTFYKNVMAPAGRHSPLRIQTFELTPAAGARRFRYRLVLVQPGDKQRDLSGQVEFRLQGRRDGKPVALDAGAMLDGGKAPGFRFRYFQELAGNLTIPKGVEPVSFEVIVHPDGQEKGVVHSEIPVPAAGNTGADHS